MVSVSGLVFVGGQAEAQSARPSPAETAVVAPPVEIAGLDAKPLVPLEFSRAWLAKAERVRRTRAELQARARAFESEVSECDQ